MSLLRFAARSLLASYFINEGVSAFRNASALAPQAEPLTTTIAPLVQRVVPSELSSYVPDQAETWVRATGALQVAGGVMFATGIGRRLGAVALAKASVLNLMMAWPGAGADRDEKAAARPELLKHGALLGACVLGALDLQGKPSLSWRSQQAGKKIEATAGKASQRATKASQRADIRAKRLAKVASKQARKARKAQD
ncbi:MAG: DoxX family membrane protein [Arachnia sp.]